MKTELTPDCCPVITLSQGDIKRLESGYKVIEEMAFKGRVGCLIGDQPYSAEAMGGHARFQLGILRAAKKVVAPQVPTPPAQ